MPPERKAFALSLIDMKWFFVTPVARDALAQRSMFNNIDMNTAFTIDLVTRAASRPVSPSSGNAAQRSRYTDFALDASRYITLRRFLVTASHDRTRRSRPTGQTARSVQSSMS